MNNKIAITEGNNQLKFSDWAISLCTHLVIAALLAFILHENQRPPKIVKTKPFKVSLLRGLPSSPSKKSNKKKSFVKSRSSLLNFNKLGTLSLSKLSPQVKSPPTQKLNPKKTKSFKLLRLPKQQVQLQQRSERLLQKNLQLHNLQENRIKSIRSSSFDISLEVPDGVAEDELNKIEQIFYSFRKRMVETYMSSFNRSLNDLEQSYPHYLNGIFNEKITLTGKVSFDKEGNITKIRVLKKGRDKTLNQFFFKTLEGIKKLPNPPHDFVTNGEEFSIYYHLIIE